jgi:hypothetical protein
MFVRESLKAVRLTINAPVSPEAADYEEIFTEALNQ